MESFRPKAPSSLKALIAENLIKCRHRKGMTLSGLAEISGMGKGTLTGLEKGDVDPSLEILWRLSKALNVPCGVLINGTNHDRISSHDKITVELIASEHDTHVVETYMIRLAPYAQHQAEPHTDGVREQILVLTGRMLTGTLQHPSVLTSGETHAFDADTEHLYQAFSEPTSALVTIIYPGTSLALQSHHQTMLPYPESENDWDGLYEMIERLKHEIQQGLPAACIALKPETPYCDTMILALKERLAALHAPSHDHIHTLITSNEGLYIHLIPRRGQPARLETPSTANDIMSDACHLVNRASADWHPLSAPEADALRLNVLGNSLLRAVLSAEILMRHHMTTLPPLIQHKRMLARHATTQRDGYLEERLDINPDSVYGLLQPAFARRPVAIAHAMMRYREPAEEQVNALDLNASDGISLYMLLELLPDLNVTALESEEEDFAYLGQRFAHFSNVHPLYQSIVDLPAHGQFDVAFSTGVLHPTNVVYGLQCCHQHLTPGGLLIICDEMIEPFIDRDGRKRNLLTHHLHYILDTLIDIPLQQISHAEHTLVNLIRNMVPSALMHAHVGNTDTAVHLVQTLLDRINILPLPEPPTHANLGVYRFHALELEALVADLVYETERKTYAECFIDLAQQNGFQLLEHQRIYPTCGIASNAAGLHLFVFESL